MDPEIRIKIKSTADLKATEDAKRANEQLAKAYKDLGKDASAVEAEIKKLDTALKSDEAAAVRATEAQKKLDEVAGRGKKSFSEYAREIPGVGRALDLLKNPVALAVAAFTALAGAIKKSLSEFAGAETQYARLDSALARSGQLTDEYRSKLHNLAGQLQETTGVADDQWLEVLRKLTQFGANPGNIDQLAEGVENLAGVMDGDLAGAADLVGRAIQGNYEAFGRYGIELETTGDKARDLEALLKKLAELGAGQLKAANETMEGGFRKLKNAAGDFFEAIGGVISSTRAVQLVTYGFAESLDWLGKKIAPTIPVLDGLKNKTREAGESLAEAKDGAREFADNLGDVRTEAEAIAAALTAALEAKKKLLGEEDERDTAREELALATIDRDEAAGRMSGSDARIKRAGVKGYYAERRHTRKQTLLREELDLITEKDRMAEASIEEITGQIGAAQTTTANANALEERRQRTGRLKEEMLAAMRDEELLAYKQEGIDDPKVDPELMTARVEGKRQRYLEAALELGDLAGGLPRNTPFPITARAREEAVTEAGVKRISELNAERVGLGFRADALRSQLETGDIRFALGRQADTTRLEAAAYQEQRQQKQQVGGAIMQNAQSGGGRDPNLDAAVQSLNRLGASIERVPAALVREIEAVAKRAEQAAAKAEQAANWHRHGNR